MRWLVLAGCAVALIAAACSGSGSESDPATSVPPASSTIAGPEPSATTPAEPSASESTEAPAQASRPLSGATLRRDLGYEFPPAPVVPDGDLAPDVGEAIDAVFDSLTTAVSLTDLGVMGDSGDARVAWLLSDLLRFFQQGEVFLAAINAYENLTGVELLADPVAARSPWQSVTDHMIAWDLPEPPGYVKWKRQLFTLVDPRWDPFFADENANVDWRLLSWGGVLLDDRPLGDPNPCARGCIPALDDPAVTLATGGDWYPDEALVFGVEIEGQARAYPKNIMEIHEMVNDTVGGRRLGIPYCTLCGSAQAYFTDSVPLGVAQPVLRTSGLLSRSNKVMFDLETFSVFDTFTGEALSGPLAAAGVKLEQTSIVTSTWADWKAAHPDTTIVAQDGGIGRTYPLDPLAGRDSGGPIFPTGDVDERLPVQAEVLGVETPDGTTIAFPVVEARVALDAGDNVELEGVVLVSDGSGLRAELTDGTPVVGHQAFWFAWSQFHPETLVWAPPLGS